MPEHMIADKIASQSKNALHRFWLTDRSVNERVLPNHIKQSQQIQYAPRSTCREMNDAKQFHLIRLPQITEYMNQFHAELFRVMESSRVLWLSGPVLHEQTPESVEALPDKLTNNLYELNCAGGILAEYLDTLYGGVTANQPIATSPATDRPSNQRNTASSGISSTGGCARPSSTSI